MTKVFAKDAPPIIREMFELFQRAREIVESEGFDGDPFPRALGELIVKHHFADMAKAPRGTKGFDFIDGAGRRVQLKAWYSAKRTHDKIDLAHCDRFIRIQLHDDGWTVMADFLTAPIGTAGVFNIGKTFPQTA